MNFPRSIGLTEHTLDMEVLSKSELWESTHRSLFSGITKPTGDIGISSSGLTQKIQG